MSVLEVIGAIAAGFAIIGAVYKFYQWLQGEGRKVKRIVVETVGLTVSDENEELVREKLGIPKHSLGVRCRNEGNQSEVLTGYGILAVQCGKEKTKLMESPVDSEDPGNFPPGEYHEFIIDLCDTSVKLREIMHWKGDVELRGLYVGRDGTEYTSSPVSLHLKTLDLNYK
jgi:hypothetical protein